MESREFERTISECQSGWLTLGLRFFGGSEADARDALQETLLRLWVVRSRLSTPDDVQALGTRIMKNQCVSIHRRRNALRSHEAAPPDQLTDSAHEAVVHSEEQDTLRWAIDHLPLATRCLLQMHLYEEMSLDEIAVRTGKKKTSVKTMISRAKQQITQWIRTRQ